MARNVLSYISARTEDLKTVESAPAAFFPLSAACRCASRPPSNPTEFIPIFEPSQKWLGSPAFGAFVFSITRLSRMERPHPILELAGEPEHAANSLL
jgi:hypothetical protein